MAGKRISALTEQTGLSSGDFFGVDNAGQTQSKKLNSEYFTKRFSNVQNDASFPTGDAYSSSSSYKVGDYVTHNDVLYRCKTACSAASWTVNATNFKEASLTKAVTELNSSLPDLTTDSSDSHVDVDYCKIKDVKVVSISFHALSKAADAAIVTLPSGYRPTAALTRYFYAYTNSAGSSMGVKVNTNGTICPTASWASAYGNITLVFE